ncbi:CCR4-Not complex component, Not1-domain-containing protein [Blakeslea trispora]|nr:CCR4-Not complex component, Not1-domain-containing protein [Blakeslea trispora]
MSSKEIHNRCLQTFPKIIDMKAQAMSATAGAEVSFKPEIEEEANMYYERIYSGEMSMDAMIELLKRLSASKDARDQDIYACMIHNLFDEYSFFPKYPEKELSITNQQGDSTVIQPIRTHLFLSRVCMFPLSKQTDEIAYSEPPSSVKDKVLFTVNNVALNNLETKVNDLKEALQPTSFKWFSNYLVVKRISSELNNHELYVLMLDLFDSKLLHLHVLNETFANILVLLNSDKAVANSSERALLKNLGSWLGITIGRYDTQRLIVTIPFVCKVLEQCAESKVFKPPNPWTLSILKLLVELYDHAELKLNLKFEIEVLCKGLSIELKSITPTNMLQSRQQPAVALQKNAFASQPNERSGETESSMEALPVPNLAPYLVFDPQIVLYTTQPGAKRLALQAFNESMREFIGPVVERAVAIAVQRFLTEMDENKMRKAAHLMVQNLAASLAMVTSKEPLRLSMVANLRAIFVAHGLNDSMAEQAIILTIADNLDTMSHQSNEHQLDYRFYLSKVKYVTLFDKSLYLLCQVTIKRKLPECFAQRVVQLLYRSERQLAIELLCSLLEHLCEVSPNVGTLVTSWLNMQTMSVNTMCLSHGRISVIEFTVSLIRACLLSDYPLATRQEFVSSLQALNRLKTSYPSVASLFDDLTNIPISNNNCNDLRRMPVGNSKESNMRDQLQFYFAEWSEDGSFLFFRVAIEVSIEHALKLKMLPAQSAPNVVYQPIDALSKLIVTLVQIEGQPTHLKRALSVTVLHIAQHHEMRGSLFDQRPFLRLLTSILNDLHLMEQQLQKQYISLLSCFSDTLYTLQPSYFPGFVFAWLQLVSHRFFMPQLLMAENQKEWAMFQRLVVCLFKFLSPYLSRTELRDTTHMLYRGALRMLLILLHDFPEFLCDYHYSFCDTIPATCIQMRNLVLSAFPRNMRLPDPFTPNLKVDLLPEIHQPPRILSNYSSKLEEAGLKHELDDCIEKSDARALKEILSQQVRKNSMNASVINAIVLHLGILTVAKGTPVHQGPAIDVYQHLLSELDSEGRYIFLSALANQLRYPNSHTHYFSCVLLYLFVQSKKETVKEQITRVLLERLIVNRPHPWGLLITFIELIKNPRYSFWSHSFTRCATDIERLFESVSSKNIK